jgi:phage FluMu gp28-like protein
MSTLATVQAKPWVNPYKAPDPRSMLLEYQHRYFADPSRWKIGLWSRQTGKDFTTSGEAVADSLARPGTRWMIAAPSERQSLESLDKAKEWANAFDFAIADITEDREAGAETLLKSAEIKFANGSRIRAVPGKPNTVRGESANIILTEFDFFETPAETWRAILPSITNPLRGGEKKVRIITTPNGIGSQTHKLWTKTGGKVQWSKHKVTIHDAKAMGLPVDIDELREMFADADGWAQEFECEFLDTASVLLPYDLIIPCENPLATHVVEPGYWLTRTPGAPPVDLGIDFGRKRDLTVCWALEDIFGFGMTREVLELAKMSTPDQVDVLRPRIAKARRACLDYTGPGIGLGDLLVKEFGQWDPEHDRFGKVELCQFTNGFKLEIFPKMKMRFESRTLGIPTRIVIREDLHSINRIVTAHGNLTYSAPHTDDGHADRCTGLALAVRAQSFGGAYSITLPVSYSIGGEAMQAKKTREVWA